MELLTRWDPDPSKWTDDGLRRVITQDRILQEAESKERKRPTAEDNKRLGYIKALIFEANIGDLIVVPLGKGLDGDVAIGEFTGNPGEVKTVSIQDGETQFLTVGRSIRWLNTVKRRRFSEALNKSLHAPTAIHLVERSHREPVYLAAYGSFTYDDIYVASFPSAKERFTTTDQATIGIWFNALAVVHRHQINNQSIPADETIYELGIEDSGVDLELTKNSPWTPVMRTVGPLAFSAMAVYAMAVEARPLSEMKNAVVSAKPVVAAVDKCKVIIPDDMQAIAKGYGHGRWAAQCRLAEKVKAGATIKPTAHLKPHSKQPR